MTKRERRYKRGPRKKRPLGERFWEKTIKDPDSDCILWCGCRTGRGYGHFSVQHDKSSSLAHRVAFELHHGKPIPRGKLILHSCDNPRCVNPAHLRIGTYRDNSQDMVSRERTAFKARRRNHTKEIGMLALIAAIKRMDD